MHEQTHKHARGPLGRGGYPFFVDDFRHPWPDRIMRLYVVCHDDPSERQAAGMCERYVDDGGEVRASPLRLPGGPTPFCESAAFARILDVREEWATEDYVGVLTHTFEKKVVERYFDVIPDLFRKRRWTSREWKSIASDAGSRDLDVLGMVDMRFRKCGRPVSTLEGAVLNHGLSFYRAWRELLLRMGYTEAQILDRDVPFFASNWWIARPSCMEAYARFVRAAQDAVVAGAGSGESCLAELFAEDALYRSARDVEQVRRAFGADHFTLHPFVFERLPGFYFRHGRPEAAKIGHHLFHKSSHVIQTYD